MGYIPYRNERVDLFNNVYSIDGLRLKCYAPYSNLPHLIFALTANPRIGDYISRGHSLSDLNGAISSALLDCRRDDCVFTYSPKSSYNGFLFVGTYKNLGARVSVSDVSFSSNIPYEDSYSHHSSELLKGTFKDESNYTVLYAPFSNLKPSYCVFEMDFNPNKLSDVHLSEINYILSLCSEISIKRLDVAIDLPVQRSLLSLQKDTRNYKFMGASRDSLTEYLGARSSIGAVKLYSKTSERGLSHYVSRLEVTCEPSISSFEKYFPVVNSAVGLYEGRQISLYDVDVDVLDCYAVSHCLNDTQRYILGRAISSLRDGSDPGLIQYRSIGRGMRKKIDPFINSFQVCSLHISDYEDFVNDLINDYVNMIAIRELK